MIALNELALDFKNKMSQDVFKFLTEQRALTQNVITAFGLGVSGNRISIPVTDQNLNVTDIRLYLPPHNRKGKGQKVIGQKGVDGSAKLFPQEILSLIKLKRHNDEVEELENLDIVERLEKYKSIYDSIVNWNTLFLVEGELDALAMISKGFLAITNTCGVNGWKKDFAESLVDLNISVVICMDADDPGEIGAEARAEGLLQNNINVSVVEWPFGTPPGHDVTDEIIKNGFDGLSQIIGNAVKYRDVLSLDEVVAENVEWLFEPYLAVGKVSLIEGHPGIGKTFLMLKVAASVSMGGKDLLSQSDFQPANVLLMTAEDGIADTIKPRIEKMNADLKKILVPKELFTLDVKGFEVLEGLISRYEPKLVIIDPMMPFLGSKADSNKATDMRPFFKQLGKLAIRYKCAVVVTRHLAKSVDRIGITAGLGSIDISAAVRSILQVAEDKDVKGLKRVTHVKCNIGQKGKPFGYRLDEGLFSWAEVADESEVDESELGRACQFLQETLSNGPVPALEVEQQAKDISISRSTLNRAKKKVKVKSERVTKDGVLIHWNWYLSDENKGETQQDFQGTQGVLLEGTQDLTEEEA